METPKRKRKRCQGQFVMFDRTELLDELLAQISDEAS
jgi:hypothetical protein